MATDRGESGVEGLFGRGSIAGLPEAQILERFALDRDGAAFESLIARHGATVLGVCRRFLRDPNDVEDAFQATFVILARKASGLRDRAALGPWLHGVAARVASRARADAVRRRRREATDERAVALAPAPAPGRPDLGWVLDEEILRLPAKLRLPVVLCLIEGQTYDEAASQLHWTAATVRGRLAEARVRLRARLLRRGEGVAVVPGLLGPETVVVPPALIDRAAQLVLGWVGGRVLASSAVSLANRTMGGWIMTKTMTVGVALLATGIVLGAGSVGLARLRPGRGAPDGPPPRAGGTSAGPEIRPVAATPAPAPKRLPGPDGATIHPITVAGRALDAAGRPVAGAAIVVTNANRTYTGGVVLGRATADRDGRYLIRDLPLPVLPPEPGPIARAAEGKFEVAGSAPGLAFTWHAIQSYRPEPAPADRAQPPSDLVIFPGQPVVADLVFGPPARIRGRVTDDQGRPVTGARVQVGYIDSTRNPGGYGMWNCAAINPEGGDELKFNGVGSLPAEVRSTRTDADGRYELANLPREVKLLALIDHDPTVEPFEATVATSASRFDGVRSLGHDGTLDHSFVLPRPVRVRVLLADSGRPAERVTVLARGETVRRGGGIGTTGPDGQATLQLPPGTYRLRVEPPVGLPYLLTEAPVVVVTPAPAEAAVEVTLNRGMVVDLEAVDAATGRGVAGVGFRFVADNVATPRAVHTQTAHVDHPTTDEAGKLQIVMEPARGRFVLDRLPRGYEAAGTNVPTGMVEGDGKVAARFALQRRGQEPPIIEDEVGHRLRLLRQAQAQRLTRGRMRVVQAAQMGTSISPARLRALLAAFDPDQIPPLLDRIRREFPDAPPMSSGRMDLTVDGPRRRQETFWSGLPNQVAPEVTVGNGYETISYNPANAQVDIGDAGKKSGLHLAVADVGEFSHWPIWGGNLVERAPGRVTLELAREGTVARMVCDEATGFAYLDSRGGASGTSGRETWQFAPRATASGGIIPGLSVNFTYQGDTTSMIRINTIESVDLDSPVPPGAFLVAVPRGTQVRDYREGRDDTYRGVTRWPVTDVVAHADADPRRFRPFVPPVQVGDVAPALDPPVWLDRAGRTAAPPLEGQVVLVDFWGIDCGFCVVQLPEVREAVEHFAGKGLVLVSLHDSSGTVEQVAAFARKRDVTWPIAIDRPGEGFGATFAAYGVRAIPRAAVIDRHGRLAFLGEFKGALIKAASLLAEE